MSQRSRPLAGLSGTALGHDELSPYHALARQRALDAFGRMYEDGLPAPELDPAVLGPTDDPPSYAIVDLHDGELIVLAGARLRSGAALGRLVAPRDLLELLLDDLGRSAVWCDEHGDECLALTAYDVRLGGDELLLVAARSARVLDERPGHTALAYAEEREREGDWEAEALETLLLERDGDLLLIPASSLVAIGHELGLGPMIGFPADSA
ncbi:MAG TPA: hypothetical protein VEA99_05050 [Gemmatimonadaceae bacterium]|nr:hypothetical protein [Gemmatimonadaceae bacterium]